jgi:sigma-B regulation protein RsbU (phosphoserine phosphatase)
MALLVTLEGPEVGRSFPLEDAVVILGRQFDSAICLGAKAVSRQHAQIQRQGSNYFIEDLNSSNGTYLNNKRLTPRTRVLFSERDTLQVGPYVFALRPAPTLATTEPNLVIREQVSALTMNQSVYGQDPAQKLQVVMDIAQHLARTLDIEALLDRLLEHLIQLFPPADRGMVLLCEDDRLVVRGQRFRGHDDDSAYPFSRTVVRRVLDEGIGVLSEDVHDDQRFAGSKTLTSLDMRSLLCVPLIGQNGRRLGIIQLDRFRVGMPFTIEDLQLLTAIGLQVAVVLENSALHAELLLKERLDQELALAREIQQSFLPSDFDEFRGAGFEVFASVHPAREVSGDLYDYLTLRDGRLAFFVGDVSGKGMPAALFMIAVRSLGRHLAASGDSPSATLNKLNDALSGDNNSGLFVTLAHGLYDPSSGQVALASGGHPLPLLRRAGGLVEELSHRTGRLLGYESGELHLIDAHFALVPGELMVIYTDGFIEARGPDRKIQFGLERLKEVVRGFDETLSLAECAELAKEAIDQFTQAKELQDDQTLFLLRRGR